MKQTVYIRYRCGDGELVEEGGRWLPMDVEVPSFERTGMRLHEFLQRTNAEGGPTRLVAVDRMVWKAL